MLILTTRLDESLRIGDDVTLKILGVRGKQVRIGVNAPPSVPGRSPAVLGRRGPRRGGSPPRCPPPHPRGGQLHPVSPRLPCRRSPPPGSRTAPRKAPPPAWRLPGAGRPRPRPRWCFSRP